MAFTDDDLKRLKECGYQLFGYSTKHFEALSEAGLQ